MGGLGVRLAQRLTGQIIADQNGMMGTMMQDLAFAIPGVDEAMSFAEIMKYVRPKPNQAISPLFKLTVPNPDTSNPWNTLLSCSTRRQQGTLCGSSLFRASSKRRWGSSRR
jgi:hypothetical protein